VLGSDYTWRVVAGSARRELNRLMRARVRLLAGMVQPLVILFALGAGLDKAVSLTATGEPPYRLFVAAGAAVTALTTTCMYSALSIVGDRQSGFLRSMLVSPAPRLALLLGRTLAVSLIGTVQVLAVLLCAVPLGLRLSVGAVLLSMAAGAICAFAISGIGTLIAASLDRQENVNAVNQLALLPLIFLSGGVYALNSAPAALRIAGYLDPLKYAVDVLRYGFVGTSPTPALPGPVGLTIGADCLVMLLVGITGLVVGSVVLGKERH
jgi:ABC-2 type transport system permease protein